MKTPGNSERAIHVSIFQPALPHYRVPFFRELASRPGIHLTLHYGSAPNAPANARPEGFDAVPARIHPFRMAGVPWFWQEGMWRNAAAGNTDVLVFDWDAHYLSLAPAIARARHNGIGTVLWGHGYSKLGAGLRDVPRTHLGSKADALLFYNYTIASAFQRGHRLDPRRIHVALNALDQSEISMARKFWQSRPDKLKRFQEEEGLAGEQCILFVSRLDQANRVDLLIDAVRLLRRDIPKIKAIIIGQGPHSRHLHQQVADCGLENHVRFVGAVYDEMQLAPWFLSAQAFCYPANLGLSVLHAFGYGLPVITGNAFRRHNPEIEAVVHGHNGLLFADGVVADLALTLRHLLQTPEFRQRLSAGAIETVQERFTLQRMVDGAERAIRFAYGRSHGQWTGDCDPLPAPASPIPVASPKTKVAIVLNSHTPYRECMHLRLVREATDVDWWTLYTHETSSSPWEFNVPIDIRPVSFGPGEPARNQMNPRFAAREWIKGGRITKWLQAERIDAVIALGYNDLGRLRMIQWCHARGIPCLLWGDSNIMADRRRKWRRLFKRFLLPPVLARCAAILAVGQRGIEYFRSYGISPDRIFVAPLEPDYQANHQIGDSEIDEMARRFHIDRGRRRLIYCGRLAREKRVDLIIRAFAAIASSRPDWDLLLVGTGPLRSHLADLVPADLADRVIWPGFISAQREIAALYRLCDALVLASDSEPWALVVNEAAAAGLALVTSNVVGAAAELVRENVNGFTFPAGNLASLTDKLLRVTDPNAIDSLKTRSSEVLAEWRSRADVVRGVLRALSYCGVSVGRPIDHELSESAISSAAATPFSFDHAASDTD